MRDMEANKRRWRGRPARCPRERPAPAKERAGRMPTPQRAGRPRYKLLVRVCTRSLAFNF